MFFSNLFKQKRTRTFSYTPFYYEVDEEKGEAEDGPRIRFKRLTRGTVSSKNSVRMKVLFAVLLVVFLYYFQSLLEDDQKDFRIEDVRIEATPNLN